MKRTTILAAVVALALAATARAGPRRSSTGRARSRPGPRSRSRASTAAIVATGAPGGDVEVTAIKKGRKSDPAEVKIDVVEHAGGVTICAVYPSSGTPNECKPGEGGRMNVRDNDVNVEFRVKVPAGVRFVGRTVNGGIEASGIPADAEAHTVNGGVELDATGTARAETVNGGITARLGRADWDGRPQAQDRQRRDRRGPARGPERRREGIDGERRHPDRLPAHRHRPDLAPEARRARSAAAAGSSRWRRSTAASSCGRPARSSRHPEELRPPPRDEGSAISAPTRRPSQGSGRVGAESADCLRSPAVRRPRAPTRRPSQGSGRVGCLDCGSLGRRLERRPRDDVASRLRCEVPSCPFD